MSPNEVKQLPDHADGCRGLARLEMTRFYFDLIDHEGLKAIDTEGIEFANIAAARAEALKSLGSMSREELGGGHPASFSIEIRNAD
jgi:hypothetical protein